MVAEVEVVGVWLGVFAFAAVDVLGVDEVADVVGVVVAVAAVAGAPVSCASFSCKTQCTQRHAPPAA